MSDYFEIEARLREALEHKREHRGRQLNATPSDKKRQFLSNLCQGMGRRTRVSIESMEERGP
jgi:hypothetical protein